MPNQIRQFDWAQSRRLPCRWETKEMNSKHITKKTQNLPKYKENKNKTSHLKNTTGETRNNTRFLLVFITYIYLFVYNAAAAEF